MSSPAAKTKKMSGVTPYKTMRHTWSVFGVAHLPGGQCIMTCSWDGSLQLWDLESGAPIGDEWRDEGDGARFTTMALSQNGETLASGSNDGTVRLWDIETGKVIAKWKEHTRIVYSVCWSPDGERVVSGCEGGTARVWDVESREPIQGLNPIKIGHDMVHAVSYSPEATMIATGDDEIKIWDAKTGKLLNTIEVYGDFEDDSEDDPVDVWSLTWTSDEKKLIAGLANGSTRIFDTATWQQIADLEGHTDAVYSLTLFSNDRLLASTSWDNTARLWNLNTNLQVGSPLQHEEYVYCAAFSADGKLLSTGGQDENAYVWDVQAILKAAGLEDLLTIPNAQKSELKKKLLSSTNATRRPPIRPVPRQVPTGFFDNVQDRNPPSVHRRRRAFAPSWGSRPLALLARIPSLFRRSRPNVDEPIELQQRPGPPGSTNSSHCSPHVVDVAAIRDREVLFVARRPETASEKAKRIKNPKPWVRVVLFLCCVSPGTDVGPGTNETSRSIDKLLLSNVV